MACSECSVRWLLPDLGLLPRGLLAITSLQVCRGHDLSKSDRSKLRRTVRFHITSHPTRAKPADDENVSRRDALSSGPTITRIAPPAAHLQERDSPPSKIQQAPRLVVWLEGSS